MDPKKAFLNNKRLICLYFAKTHTHCAEFYSKRNRNFYAASIVSTLGALFLSNSKTSEGFIAKFFIYFFPTLSAQVATELAQLSIASIGLVAVVVFCWQLFARYEERSFIHKQFSSDYYNIARKIERIISSNHVDDDVLHDLSKLINLTNRHAPHISEKIRGIEAGLLKETKDQQNFIQSYLDRGNEPDQGQRSDKADKPKGPNK